MPERSTVARPLEELQTPLGVASKRVIERPVQTAVNPVMGLTIGLLLVVITTLLLLAPVAQLLTS